MIMPSLALWVSNAQIIKLNKLLFRHYSATDVTAFGNRVFAVCVLLKHNEAQKTYSVISHCVKSRLLYHKTLNMRQMTV